MKNKFFTKLILTFAMVFSVSFAFSQDYLAGANFDFTASTPGNYAGWRGYKGTNATSSPYTTPTLGSWTGYDNPALVVLGSGSSSTPCFVINSNVDETDPVVPALKKIPTGYSRSTRINCKLISGTDYNANANMLTYDLLVTPQNCLLTFNFAMVLQDGGHTGWDNPFFMIKVMKLDEGGNEIGLAQECATFEALGKTNPIPPGFATYSDGIWQNWKQISMNLTNNIGENVRIKVILASCAYTIHYAYGYFVGKVGPSVLTVNACGQGDTAAVITATSGFAKYEWYKNTGNRPESQLSELAVGTPLYSSEQNGTQPANNNFVITNSTYNQHGEYYFVKVTSPSSSTGVPGCIAYMKARVQVIKPVTEYTFTTDCQLTAAFTNGTTFPVDDEGAIKQYHWDFGDGTQVDYTSEDTNTNVNINPTHVYTTPGTYTVTLTASYNGCEKTISHEVEIPATPSFSLTDTMICIGTSINIPIENPAMTQDVTYTWNNPNDPNNPFEGVVYTATFNQRTEIIVNAEAPSCTYSDTIIVDVQNFPEITLIGDTMLCLGEQSNITAMDATGNTQAMQWSFTDPGNPPQFNPNQPTTTEPVLIFTPTQNTTVYLIARTSQGCMASKSLNISITDPKVIANKYKVCPGDPVILTGMDAVDYSWSADPADATLPTGRSDQPVTAHPEETTIYTMRGYGASGCYAERTIRIQVVPFPEAAISFSPAYVDVDNPVLSLRDISQWGTSSSWTISDGTTSDARSFSHRFNDVSGQDVQIYLTTFNEVGCSDTTSVIVPIELFSVWVPSGFTPDGDGVNDRFFFRSTNRLEDVKLEVYNRWGERVYLFEDDYLDCSSLDSQALENKYGWDGQKSGVNVPIGTYVWRLSYKRLGNKRVYDRSGTINIIR